PVAARRGRLAARVGRARAGAPCDPGEQARGLVGARPLPAAGHREATGPRGSTVIKTPAMSEADPKLRVRRSGPLAGTCRVPGDKSVSHRALLFGALADGPVEATGLGRGGDNLSTAAALRALGVDVAIEGSDARIHGVGFAGLRASAETLDCGNSGTTIRLLMGLLAGRPFTTTMAGDASLTRRPM